MYHVTDPEISTTTDDTAASRTDGNPGGAADWRIALRVEPDAEGPSAGKLKLAATSNSQVSVQIYTRYVRFSGGKQKRAPHRQKDFTFLCVIFIFI